MDEKELEDSLSNQNKVNGIYLLNGDTSFVLNDSFEKGKQDHEKFLEGGLARGLVHTADKRAAVLSPIVNNIEYPNGVNVYGFDLVKEPALRVVSLYSGGGVGGDGWDGSYIGCVFWGLISGEASAQKNLI